MCHGSKVKCLFRGVLAKKAQSNKAENELKKKKAKKEQEKEKASPPGVRYVEIGGQEEMLESIAESFKSIANSLKTITIQTRRSAVMAESNQNTLNLHYHIMRSMYNMQKERLDGIANEIGYL
jgi:hypothetical protein